jgi:ParB-like chromosome segregation protein Spo0J
MTDDDLTNVPSFLDHRPPAEDSSPCSAEDQPVEGLRHSLTNDKEEASEMQPHPYADLFPHMKNEDFRKLVADIRDHGLQEPIVTYEGKILDGRNRAAACSNLQVKPLYTEYRGSAPLTYVMSKNLHRRHLSASQRSMVASKLADLKSGQRADEVSGTSIDAAAKIMNVGRASVDRAKTVRASGDGELIEAVENGKVAVSAAAKRIKSNAQVAAPKLTDAELQSQRLMKLWDKTGSEGRELFLEGIGATI